MQLGHIIEVHPVDTRNERRDYKDRCPGADLLSLIILSYTNKGEVHYKDIREHVAETLRRLFYSQHAVMEVMEVASYLRVDVVLITLSNPLQCPGQRAYCSLKLHQLSGELVYPLRGACVSTKDLALDLLNVCP